MKANNKNKHKKKHIYTALIQPFNLFCFITSTSITYIHYVWLTSSRCFFSIVVLRMLEKINYLNGPFKTTQFWPRVGHYFGALSDINNPIFYSNMDVILIFFCFQRRSSVFRSSWEGRGFETLTRGRTTRKRPIRSVELPPTEPKRKSTESKIMPTITPRYRNHHHHHHHRHRCTSF